MVPPKNRDSSSQLFFCAGTPHNYGLHKEITRDSDIVLEGPFCVPCCKRKPVVATSQQARRDKACAETRVCTTETAARAPSKSAYVMVTNKELPADRIGAVPNDVGDILGPNMLGAFHSSQKNVDGNNILH